MPRLRLRTRSLPRLLAVAGLLLLASPPPHGDAQEPASDPAVVLVTIDGLRWQEVLTGMDRALLTEEQGVSSPEALLERFWHDDPTSRRGALLPFLWSTVADSGQLFVDPTKQSGARVTNGRDFSYPGYSEILVGFPDDRIDSNDKVTNPNRTVLEHLVEHGTLELGEVAVFGSWDVFPWIVAHERSGIFVNAGWQPLELTPDTPAQRMLNSLMMTTPREWAGVRFDSFTFQAALSHLERERPRLLYLALGEPDDWAHGRRYDRYIESTRRCDDQIAELWEWLESQPDYAGQTTLILTTDHGRGRGAEDWTSHGSDVDGADEAWLAVLGPGVPARGHREDTAVTLAQVAATVARIFGVDLVGIDDRVAPPLPVFD